MTREAVADKVKMGGAGWLVGWNLGRPFDGKPDWRNLSFFEPLIDRATEPALNPEDPASLPDFPAKPFGVANLKLGFRPGMTGAFSNPFRESGYSLWFTNTVQVTPGAAAQSAVRDAQSFHSGEALAAAAFWAAAIAVAPFETSVAGCLARGMGAVPAGSRLQGIPKGLIDAKRAGCTWQVARDRLLDWLGVVPEDACATFGFAYLAAMYGDGDFGKSVCIAAGCGGASSAQAAVVGAMLCAGTGLMPDDWFAPVSSSPSLQQRYDNALALLKQEQFDNYFEPPTPAGAVEASAPDDRFLSDFSAVQMDLASRKPESSVRSASLLVAATFPDGVCAPRSSVHPVAFRIHNLADEPIEIDPKVGGSAGVNIAHRANRIRLDPNASAFVAAIAQVDHGAKGPRASIDANGVSMSVPLIEPIRFWVASPFDNRAQLGYERVFAPETDTNPNAVFKGRSDAIIKWCEFHLCGCELDLEPHFVGAAGVLYLTTELLFDVKNVSAVIATPIGQVVWVNREKRSWYHDTHRIWPKAASPYLTALGNDGWTQLLIKVVRNDAPLPLSVIYFLDAKGEIIRPVGSRQPFTG